MEKPKLFSKEKRIARNKRAIVRKTKKKDLTTSKRMELVNTLKKQLGEGGYNQIRKDASKVKLTRSQKSAISKINNYYDYEQGKDKSIAKRKKRITKLSNKPKMAMKKPKLNAGFDKLPKTVQSKIMKNKKPKLTGVVKPKMGMKKPKLVGPSSKKKKSLKGYLNNINAIIAGDKKKKKPKVFTTPQNKQHLALKKRADKRDKKTKK
tara:strand:- start:1478 stop:2098 length:621 start_codon:yes stop_codon:yes gene_type:complete